MEPPILTALTIAGSDSGGGAGVIADTATFRALGVWATVAVTAVTAQSTVGVEAVVPLDPELVRAQIRAVATDIPLAAVKTGMLATAQTVGAVASALEALHLPRPVVDPVLVSSSGTALLEPDAVAVLKERLLPLASVVTPNLAEAEALSGVSIATRDDMVAAGSAVLGLGCGAVLVTGGHLDGADCLVRPGQAPTWFSSPLIDTEDTHGTGCVLSAAIAARLAHGDGVEAACRAAHTFVRGALRRAHHLGRGPGPVDPVAS